MGKGDRKSKKGKISIGSFGKLRPRRNKFRVKPKVVKNEVVNGNG
ncbi:30S ribosomal protein THX [Neptunitalea lumnitzerae]|uniref:30S ribosomal protein THX n=1 Tax=Neptunitalea lumnitzerae TaxID=2965509 RepID=A0ABQ5MND3_9FLAO|nr:30S ribosomal protein THX [Neptunitalea sp. Y10]GLB50903.1 hypothetical protein Y10_32710 [Neptunitalea sp. Y10]